MFVDLLDSLSCLQLCEIKNPSEEGEGVLSLLVQQKQTKGWVLMQTCVTSQD